MRGLQFGCGSVLGLLLVTGWARLEAAPAAAPGFTLTATNVTVSDKGSGTSTFTLTSENGFSGQVGVVCSEPETIIAPMLILPSCEEPVRFVDVPLNGSVSGTMTFYPPWQMEPTSRLQDRPGGMRGSQLGGLAGGGALAAALGCGIGLRRRKAWLGWGVLLLVTLAGTTGCIGQGGLAMTHGTWVYTISGGTEASESMLITVTVD